MAIRFDELKDFPCAIIVLDDGMTPLSASREGFSVFGVRWRSDAMAARLGELKRAMEEHPDLQRSVRQVMRSGRPSTASEFRWQRGERIYLVKVGTNTATGGGVLVFGDVTQQVRFEATRELARRYLEDILNNIQAGVIVLNRELRITNMNRAEETFLHRMDIWIGWIEAIGMPVNELLTRDADLPWDEIRDTVLAKGMTFANPKRSYPTPDGDMILSVDLTPLRDQQGDVIGAILVSEDVTETVRLEEELRAAELVAERLEAIRETAVTVNHEINNPLMSILATAQTLLLSPKGIESSLEKKLRQIEKDVKRIAEVTKRLRTAEGLSSEEYIADGPRMIKIGKIGDS